MRRPVAQAFTVMATKAESFSGRQHRTIIYQRPAFSLQTSCSTHRGYLAGRLKLKTIMGPPYPRTQTSLLVPFLTPNELGGQAVNRGLRLSHGDILFPKIPTYRPLVRQSSGVPEGTDPLGQLFYTPPNRLDASVHHADFPQDARLSLNLQHGIKK